MVTQIRERAEWLAEMEYLGQAGPHREIIKEQIAERMRALDALGIDIECSTARSSDSGFSTLRSKENLQKSGSATKSGRLKLKPYYFKFITIYRCLFKIVSTFFYLQFVQTTVLDLKINLSLLQYVAADLKRKSQFLGLEERRLKMRMLQLMTSCLLCNIHLGDDSKIL